MLIDPKITKEAFNIKAESESTYRLNNFRCTNQVGWMCRLDDPLGNTVVSADVEYVLVRLVEREYPIARTNLNFAFAKIGLPAIMEDDVKPLAIEDQRSWIDKIADFCKSINGFLPNLKLELMLKGDNFLVIQCNSKKQAKKVMKSAYVRTLQTDPPEARVERRGTDIVFIEEA